MAKVSAMGKSKVTKKSSGDFAKGGKGHMIGKQSAGIDAPGVTGKVDKGNTGKFAKGGKGHMIGKQSANPDKPGKTGK